MLRLPGRLSELCKDTTSHVPSQTNVQYGVSMEQVCLKIGRISHCEDLEGFALPRNLWTARAWCLSIIYGIAVKILEDSKILSGEARRGPLFCSGLNRLATAARGAACCIASTAVSLTAQRVGRHKKAHFLKGSATSRTVRLRDLPPELFSNEAELVVLFRAKHNSLRDQIHHALSLAILTQNS